MWLIRSAAILLLLFAASDVRAERIVVIEPAGHETSRKLVDAFRERLSNKMDVGDADAAISAFNSFNFKDPFNLTSAQSIAVGQAIGCGFFVLIDGRTQRRNSSERPEYYEAYAAIYVVSSRSGRLVDWEMPSFEASTPALAEQQLDKSADNIADNVLKNIADATRRELSEPIAPKLEELAADTPQTRDFQPPIPYRRIKPGYTANAFLHSVTATIEVTLDLDDAGTITRLEISRWAGFGLNEAVEKAVRAMTWRPAYSKGKPLPMRVLLRYNFKKLDSPPS